MVHFGKKRIDVGMYEWERAEGRSKLYTRNLTACTGIATFYKPDRVGHLLHSPLHPNSSELDEFFDSVSESSEDSSSLKIWVRGGSCDYLFPQNDAYVEETRQAVEEKISALGIVERNLDIVWAEADQIVDMSLDCARGKFKESTGTLVS